MKRYILSIAILCYSLTTLIGQTQLSVSTNGPIFQGNNFSLDYWQWQISTAQSFNQPVFLEIQILDNRGRLVYKIASRVISPTQQFTLLGNQLNKEETQFIHPHYQDLLFRMHCLPIGKYTVISSLFSIASPTSPLAQNTKYWHQKQNCNTPISLFSPSENAKLCEAPNLFQWSFPTAGSNTIYEFILFEKRKNQTNAQAVSVNTPIINRQLTQPNFNINEFSFDLQKKKMYCWKIIARIDGQVVGQSPIRSFIYDDCGNGEKEISQKEKPTRKIFMKTGNLQRPPHYTITEPFLNFYFVKKIPQEEFKIQIKDAQGNVWSDEKLETKMGHNYITIPFSDLRIPDSKTTIDLTVLLNSKFQKGQAFSVSYNNTSKE